MLRAQHRWILAEVLRYLRRVGVAVEPFPGCPPAFAAGMTGQWAVAARLWEEAGNPYERALELSESDDPGEVREALALLDRLGATGTGAVLRRRLRQAGVVGVPRGPRTATRADPELLTQRQRDVLVLVAQGLTNAEIARPSGALPAHRGQPCRRGAAAARGDLAAGGGAAGRPDRGRAGRLEAWPVRRAGTCLSARSQPGVSGLALGRAGGGESAGLAPPAVGWEPQSPSWVAGAQS